MKIDYLINKPKFARQIASWFMEEWGIYNIERSLDEWEKLLCLNRDQLPLTIVGYENNEVGMEELLATATLRNAAMDTRPELKTWLSFVFTNPKFRCNGYASKIISETIKIAEMLGINRLHLWTRGNGNIYRRMGWEDIESAEYKGGSVIIMFKDLILQNPVRDF